MVEKRIALVTGASSGIGRELALIHAQRGGDLIIVARRREKLEELKREIESKHSVSVHVIVKDLSEEHASQEIYDEIKSLGLEVDYLINNAGFGGRGKFAERDWAKDRSMIQVNIVALCALTRLFLPDFITRGSGRVLNVSSIASLVPGPLQAVYFATKAFVSSFSFALVEELRGTGVSVTALLPGATATGFADAAGFSKKGMFSKAFSARGVALDGYNAMLEGKMQVMSGVSLPQRLQMNLASFAPKKMLLKQIRSLQEEK